MANPPITIGELTDVPAPLSPIASPWAQDVSRRIVHRFASTAERDAKYPANTAGNGAVCAIGPNLYVSNGSVWTQPSQQRYGAKLFLTGQTINSGVVANVSWDSKTFDTNQFAPGSNPWAGFTIPSGLDGIYAVWLNIWVAGAIAGADVVLNASAEPKPIGMGFIPNGKTQITVHATDGLAAGQAINAQIYNAHTTPVQFSGQLLIARMSL